MGNPKRYTKTVFSLEMARNFLIRAAEQVQMDRTSRDPDFQFSIRQAANQVQTIEGKLHEIECAEWERRFP